jgi:hypothetical protein
MPRKSTLPLTLSASPYLPNPLELDLQAFLEFQFWLAGELEQLVSEYRPVELPPEKVRGNKRPAMTGTAIPSRG